MARRQVYSKWLQGKIDMALSAGLTIADIGRLLNIDRTQLAKRLKRREDGDETWNDRRDTFKERIESDERDELRCQCYRAVQMSNGGITGKDVARQTGYRLADVERELIDMSRVRCGCRLVYCESGKWRACEFNNWGGKPADDHIRRYRMSEVGMWEAA